MKHIKNLLLFDLRVKYSPSNDESSKKSFNSLQVHTLSLQWTDLDHDVYFLVAIFF